MPQSGWYHRGLMPANRLSPLVRRESLGGPYFLLTFSHQEVAQEARPGQFVMLKAGESADPPLRRPVSIMSVDARSGTFTVFVKAIGQGTRTLCALAEGETAQCLGPLGHPFSPPPEGTAAAFVAGGYGVAPFFLFSQVLARTTTQLFGFSTVGAPQRTWFCCPASKASSTVEAATEDGSLGVAGLVTRPLEAWLDGQTGPVRLYACGPEPMMHAVGRLGSRRGLATELSLDPFMGCGVGTCLACVVRTQRPDEHAMEVSMRLHRRTGLRCLGGGLAGPGDLRRQGKR